MIEAERDGEIARLQKRLERERLARRESEAIAERGMRELFEKQRQVALLQQIATAANEASTVREALQRTLDLICGHIGWPVGHAYLRTDRPPDELVSAAVWAGNASELRREFTRLSEQIHFVAGAGLPGTVLLRAEPVWIADLNFVSFPFLRADAARAGGLRAGLGFPVLVGTEVAAVLEFFSDRPVAPDPALLELMAHVGAQIGRVIERERSRQALQQAHEHLERRVQERTAELASANRALKTEMQERERAQETVRRAEEKYRTIFEHAIEGNFQTSPDGRLLTGNPALARMFGCQTPEELGQLLANPENTLNYVYPEQRVEFQRLMEAHGHVFGFEYQVYRADRQIIWVSENTRAVRDPEGRLLYYEGTLEDISEHKQAAEALKRAHEELEHRVAERTYALAQANQELRQAYDATIEGWSRALDLRDKETEGHTRRVTDLTLRLAHALDLSDEDLIHVRRGALLHDIGKMGIPDSILLKPGPLTAAEWEIMRRHPIYARDMLWPIGFLRPALDIPYGHHEKWDGTGYPQGLRGEAIPLAARLFALVDVWDALRSNRPYRAAWPAARVCDHIRSLAGTHFQPGLVDAFLQVVPETGIPQDDRDRMAPAQAA